MDCIFVSYAQTDRCTIPEFANIVGLRLRSRYPFVDVSGNKIICYVTIADFMELCDL